jgi:hypothetical protein
MANVLTTAMSAAVDALTGSVGTTVTYRRGSLSVSLSATKVMHGPEAELQYGRMDFEPCDWIIKASDLELDEEVVEPQKNDVIEEADGQHWQVLPLDGEKVFRRWHGAGFRVHTKRTKAAD